MTGGPVSRGRDDTGSAAVQAVVLVGVLTTVAMFAIAVTGLLVTHRQVQAAADLAALAGAAAVQDGRPGCAAARATADANGARVDSCVVRGAELRVEATAEVRSAFGITRSVTAEARAGPAT